MKILTISIKNTLKTFLAVSTLASMVTSYADDTEVFYSVNVSKPNVMFVLDVSGSMSAKVPGSGNKSRLQVMQSALREVLEEAPDNIKVGLINYGQQHIKIHNNERKRHHAVSGVAFPATDINGLAEPVVSFYNDVDNLPDPSATITVRDFIADIADTWSPTSYTPIVDSLFEVSAYFRGEKVHFGDNLPNLNGAHPSSYTYPDSPNPDKVITNNINDTARDHGNAPEYISPIQSSCQENYIVLMTDGAPTYRTDKNQNSSTMVRTKGPFALIRNTSKGPEGPLPLAIKNCDAAAGGQWQGECGAEITHYIAENDNSDEFDGDQTIKTFVVGFGEGLSDDAKDYLKSLETINDDPDTSKIEDGYYEADKPKELVEAFTEILEDIAEPKGIMASPGYSVNVKSGLEHEKDIYIPVFDRKNSSRWGGNLKKFHIVDVDGRRIIQGQNDKNAVNELGAFTTEAHDDWSKSPSEDGPDGKKITKGGAASLLDDPDVRNLYSNITADTDLTVEDNQLIESNVTKITNELLDIREEAKGKGNKKITYVDNGSNVDDRKEMINFIRGWDKGEYDKNANPKGVARMHMGDMLHSEPLVVTYPTGQYIFAATNEGYLHVFDTTSGEEVFAFMPKELLKNIEPQFRNEGISKDHKYGIDGALTYWFTDNNNNRKIDGGERIFLYFGMRRGGTSTYALEVTNINKPKFLWMKNAEDSDLLSTNMGQSWSPPYLAKVGMGNAEKEVVIITGGYDPVEDRDVATDPGILEDASKTVETNMGKDILIFDAITGDKIFSLSEDVDSTSIVDSIPGGVRILDTNYNALIDRMYFADTGGNVWRLDLSENLGDSDSSSTLTKLAALGGSGSDSRKFFNEPDVAVMKFNGRTVFVVSIGSGFRAHPMDKSINDNFFMLIDDSAFNELDSGYETIDIGDLASIDISDSGSSASISHSGSIKDAGKRGWKVSFPEAGEKVLATSIAFDGVVVFTTLIPEVLTQGDGIDQCAAPVVQGRLYGINVLTGKAGLDLSGDGHITDADVRSVPISGGEITGKPQIVFNGLEIEATPDEQGGGADVNTSCKHPVDIRIGKKLSQVTGYDACRLESVYWSDPVNNQK